MQKAEREYRPIDNATFAARLRRERIKAGYPTVRSAAAALGINEVHLTQLETGVRLPGTKTLHKLVDGLGLDARTLFSPMHVDLPAGIKEEYAMSTAVRVSLDEFETMIARGEIFAEDDPRRFELIDGEIIEMPRPNPPHVSITNRLNSWSVRNTPEAEVLVQCQGPIGLPDLDSLPFPDVSWLREADYSARHPTSQDVFLVIEVSDGTLSHDRNAKARLYAAAGVADYWIANVQGRCFEVLRDPGPDGYATKLVFYAGDVIRPLAFPDIAFPVNLIFPES